MNILGDKNERMRETRRIRQTDIHTHTHIMNVHIIQYQSMFLRTARKIVTSTDANDPLNSKLPSQQSAASGGGKVQNDSH